MQRQSRAAREQGAHVLVSRVYLCQWPLTSMTLVPQGNCHGHMGALGPHKRPQVPSLTSWLLFLSPLTNRFLGKSL